jgi:N-acetylmuramoyl-L-alanine amidase
MPNSPLTSQVIPSPNHDLRASAIEILLLHYTGTIGADAALASLCEPTAKISCHYLVGEDARIVQLVPEAARAWHAGVSLWEGRGDVNSRSIGIEIANPGHGLGYPDFPDRQIEAVIALASDIISRHDIRPDRVLAHSDVAPTRKCDPGEKFPWARLAEAGVGLWIDPAPLDLSEGPDFGLGDRGEPITAFKRMLSAYGYGVSDGDEFDMLTAAVVTAFQRHFRPERCDGRADVSTRKTLAALLDARDLQELGRGV